ncbi:MAG: condensation domain-containing protein, partial [Bryobacteraceae bacterium]
MRWSADGLLEFAHEAEGRDKRLVAYVVMEPGRRGDLRRELSQRLPDYMVPAMFIELAELPLTPNGKLNRRNLPTPVWEGRSGGSATRTAVEEILCDICAEVLGIREIGVDQNFFELGGHSLLATQVIARVRSVFQTEVPLRVLFESPTVSGMARRLAESAAIGSIPPLVPVAREGDLPLSFAQQRLWFLDRVNPGGVAYNLPFALRLKGTLNINAVQMSLDEIVRRHEALRTCFPARQGIAIQKITPPYRVSLPLTDLSSLEEKARECEAASQMRREAEGSFDLAQGPLIRASLIRLSDDQHDLLITMHHIAADGWSIGVLVREFMSCYAAYSTGGQPELAELPVQYADFAVWQRELLQGELLESQLSYWKEQLRDIPALGLVGDYGRTRGQNNRAGTVAFTLDSALCEGLKRLARREGTTLFMVLELVFKLLLSRYSGQTDITIGSPIANRNHLRTEELIGFFVNTIALRSNVHGNLTFRDLLARERKTVLEAYAHQDLPFDKILEALETERDLSRSPLFQVMFSLQNTPWAPLELPDLRIIPRESHTAAAKFDLTVATWEDTGGTISGRWEYNADLFRQDSAERQVRHFTELLRSAVEQPDARVSQLRALSPDEERQQCEEWNSTARPFPVEPTLAALFEEQVSKTPDAIAVEYADRRLTYRELDDRANALACALQNLGVREESRVGICMERGPEMIVAVLGVVKAGAAYVPLDPGYPPARLQFMIEDSGIKVLLTETRSQGVVAELSPEILCVDEIGTRGTKARRVIASADSLAYLMYTSGSTGHPKAVMVSQQAVKRLVLNTDYVDFRLEDRIAQAANASFDAATFEIWGALLNGACVVGLTRAEILSSASFQRTLEAKRITHLFLTTALFNQYAREAKNTFRTVRNLLFGGEAVNVDCVREVLGGSGPERLLHVYGPTECATFACFHHVETIEPEAQTVPVGRPLANTETYVLDPHGELSPVGA